MLSLSSDFLYCTGFAVQRKLTLTLATLMMMFPQVVETIYSPALTQISVAFHVSAVSASLFLCLCHRCRDLGPFV